jgi:hypothetical protein
MNDASRTSTVYVMLPNGTCVPQVLCMELRRQVEDALRWLPPGVTCGIGELVTPSFWLPLGKRDRSKLGQCLAHWVVVGELPLKFAGPAKRPNKRYRLRE